MYNNFYYIRGLKQFLLKDYKNWQGTGILRRKHRVWEQWE